MTTKTDRRILRTKRNIRQAFISLIQRKALDDITVTEIAETADIDRKTFYRHYNTVLDIYNDFENELAEQIKTILLEQDDLDIAVFLRELNQILSDNLALYRVISQGSGYAFIIQRSTDLLANKLKEYYQSHQDSDLSNQEMIEIRFLASGVIGVYVDWLRQRQDLLWRIGW